MIQKNRWQWMALPTTDLRFGYLLSAQCAICFDLHTPAQTKQAAFHIALQDQVRARIGTQYPGYRAGPAEIRRPLRVIWRFFEQPAFFVLPATPVISIEELAFNSSRCFHTCLLV